MMMMTVMRNLFLLMSLLMLSMAFTHTSSAAAIDATAITLSELSSETELSADVMRQFNGERELAAERAISNNSKHQILFWMGGALLFLILFAAGFGVAMGIFGKDVFIWHVLSAGLATTLAIVHAVTAFVWFYPGSLL